MLIFLKKSPQTIIFHLPLFCFCGGVLSHVVVGTFSRFIPWLTKHLAGWQVAQEELSSHTVATAEEYSKVAKVLQRLEADDERPPYREWWDAEASTLEVGALHLLLSLSFLATCYAFLRTLVGTPKGG